MAAGLALPEVEWGVWGLTRPPSALASPRPPPGASSPRPGSSGSQCHTHVHCCQPAGLLRWAVRVEPVCRRRCDLVRALSLLPGGRSIHLHGARLRAQPGNHGHRPESPEPPGKQEAQGNSGESPPSFSHPHRLPLWWCQALPSAPLIHGPPPPLFPPREASQARWHGGLGWLPRDWTRPRCCRPPGGSAALPTARQWPPSGRLGLVTH